MTDTALSISWTRVRVRIDDAAKRVGRDPNGVQLLAVSKTKPIEVIREAYSFGQYDFGENYAQELRDKAQALTDLPKLRLHAIGGLQLNKAKYVARFAHAFHALDRADLASELSRRCEELRRVLPCYVEVSLAGEAQKSGVAPEQLKPLLDHVAALPGLRLVGLMCIPPASERAEDSRPYFAKLRALRDEHVRQHPSLAGLSMGMSADFEVAIEEGATIVRVGSLIFGER